MSNVSQNLIDQALAPAAQTAITDAMTVVEANLPSIALTDEQRTSYNAISVDNKVFAEEVLDEIRSNPTVIIPAFFNPAFLENDLQIFEQLESVETRMRNLLMRITDLKRMAGHEAYGMATAVYTLYEIGNRTGQPGAKQSYERLSARFF